MPHNIEIIKQTKNGSLLQCAECSIYQLAFGNFTYRFTEDEMGQFSLFLLEIDVAHWETHYCNCVMKRKIPIPTGQPNLFIMLNPAELEELKTLVFYKERQETKGSLGVKEIDYELFLN